MEVRHVGRRVAGRAHRAEYRASRHRHALAEPARVAVDVGRPRALALLGLALQGLESLQQDVMATPIH